MLGLMTTTLVSGRALAPREADNLYVYATFYSASGCKNQPSVAFNTHNDGCFQYNDGAKSVYFQSATNAGQYPANLVASPGKNCNCQRACISGAAAGDAYCRELSGALADAGSYRFVQLAGGCKANNC